MKKVAKVAVLDAGGQYVDLVLKAVERLGYPGAILPLDTPADKLKSNYQALIISGSPGNSGETDAPMPDPRTWKTGLPTLGICYGMQAMATAFGGKVERGPARQDGVITTDVHVDHPLFRGTKSRQRALFTHGNFVTKVPSDFRVIGSHKAHGMTVHSAIARGNLMGVQFHPEVFDDTPEGYQIFRNFLGEIAGLRPDYKLLEKQLAQTAGKLRQQIQDKTGGRHVIAFMSGGVDSSVAGALAATEIPPGRLHAYYIDNGFMRDEDEAVIDLLGYLNVPVTKTDASKDFAHATKAEGNKTIGPLRNTADPQEKRHIIGKAFIDVQNQLIQQLGLGADDVMLLQGTNAADRIESGHSKGGQHTALIKTHHNQVAEVKDLQARGLMLEPLDELFKDEVRALGRFLGLPNDVVERHPFPGPGLAIRILCLDNRQRTAWHPSEARLKKFIAKHEALAGYSSSARLLPVRNVGVGGDERSHVAPAAIKSDAPWKTLAQLVGDITGTFRDDINRVVFALGETPLDKIRLTPTRLDETARSQLRSADRIVFEEMRSSDALSAIKQCPVVLLPVSFDKPGGRSIVIRPVTTSTFMTVQPMLPGRDLPGAFTSAAAKRILEEVPGISQVFLDMTPKPPATTEWE